MSFTSCSPLAPPAVPGAETLVRWVHENYSADLDTDEKDCGSGLADTRRWFGRRFAQIPPPESRIEEDASVFVVDSFPDGSGVFAVGM